jgi:hypothetical protein
MEQLETLQTYKIEGFNDDEVEYTLIELEKGTDYETIKMQLFNKFGLLDSIAVELIQEVRIVSGLRLDEDITHEETFEKNKKTNSSNSGYSFLIIGAIFIIRGTLSMDKSELSNQSALFFIGLGIVNIIVAVYEFNKK